MGRPITRDIPRFQAERTLAWFQQKYCRVVVHWAWMAACITTFLAIPIIHSWIQHLIMKLISIHKRRLADVVEYSRLMGEDEEATIHTLTVYRGVIHTLVQQHRGRVVDCPGDNLLAEFPSVVAAVQCAITIQRELHARNAALPSHRRMVWRIGINLGDVLVDGEQLYGDGVNIAARLEGLADAGGICISGTVYDHLVNRLGARYIYRGERAVKNIATPVRVYAVQMDPGAASAWVGMKQRIAALNRPTVRWAMVGLLLIGGNGMIGGQHLAQFSVPAGFLSSHQTTTLALPDKPSIAVLPFANLTRDPDQEYFSDGITEDLITTLSQVSGLFVIARNSTYTYKGKAVRTEQISRELGVRYVVDGSVRRADGRVRVTVQLVDATTGYHLWADRYDRELHDIFALQDEITHKIVTSLAVKLQEGEALPLQETYTTNQVAWDYYIRARELFRQATKPANIQARELLTQAIELDPNFARAYATLAATHRRDWLWAWGESPEASQQQALTAAQRAVELDWDQVLPHGYKQLALIHVFQRQHEVAVQEAQEAVRRNLNDADSHAVLAEVLNYAGEFTRAIEHVQTAMRLDPYHSAHYPYVLGQAYYLLGRYAEAEDALTRSFSRNPNFMPARAYRVAVSMAQGQVERARAEMRELRKVSPTPTRQRRSSAPFKDPAITQRLQDMWHKAEES